MLDLEKKLKKEISHKDATSHEGPSRIRLQHDLEEVRRSFVPQFKQLNHASGEVGQCFACQSTTQSFVASIQSGMIHDSTQVRSMCGVPLVE